MEKAIKLIRLIRRVLLKGFNKCKHTTISIFGRFAWDVELLATLSFELSRSALTNDRRV